MTRVPPAAITNTQNGAERLAVVVMLRRIDIEYLNVLASSVHKVSFDDEIQAAVTAYLRRWSAANMPIIRAVIAKRDARINSRTRGVTKEATRHGATNGSRPVDGRRLRGETKMQDKGATAVNRLDSFFNDKVLTAASPEDASVWWRAKMDAKRKLADLPIDAIPGVAERILLELLHAHESSVLAVAGDGA